jgi:hypothetical protein
MIDNQPGSIVQTINPISPTTFDNLITHLSDKDRPVRKSAVIALGNTGDARVIEPLIFALSRELTRDAGSYPVIIEILDAMAKIPDRRALDALVKVESQLVDRDSPGCPTELPSGVITFHDMGDGCVRRAVPRELHFKVFDVMRRIGARLDYRIEEITTRYQAYQDEVIQAEIDRKMPELVRILQDDALFAYGKNAVTASVSEALDDLMAEAPQSGDAVAGIDYDKLRREMEIEVSEYVRDNERLQSLIRDGQRIKAHIQHANQEKAKYDAVRQPGRVSVR